MFVYYKIVDVFILDEVVLEVGGLAFNDQDQLGVFICWGEVWFIDCLYSKNLVYSLFVKGLYEFLGLVFCDNGFYVIQWGELICLEDCDGNGKVDVFCMVYFWLFLGNYYDYFYGLKFLFDGDMLVIFNFFWIGYGVSLFKWWGWLLKIILEGDMEFLVIGLCFFVGFMVNEKGDIFYIENQGDWVGFGWMMYLEKGDFVGNLAGLCWAVEFNLLVKLVVESILDYLGMFFFEYVKKVFVVKVFVVWFLYIILGIFIFDILVDNIGGQFGFFEGQWFVGDQGYSKIMWVYMEEIDGVYQGVVFGFIDGFVFGILWMIWGSDNSMFVGMMSWGWLVIGKVFYGLQWLVWLGKMLFEIKIMQVKFDGFLFIFIELVSNSMGSDLVFYVVIFFNYEYYKIYGSFIVDQQDGEVYQVEFSEDGFFVCLFVKGMCLGFIYQVVVEGVCFCVGKLLLYNIGYYIFNMVLGGQLKFVVIGFVEDGVVDVGFIKCFNIMFVFWIDGLDVEFNLGIKFGFKYDEIVFMVDVGVKVKLIFSNSDDMLYNFVIVKFGDVVDKVVELFM